MVETAGRWREEGEQKSGVQGSVKSVRIAGVNREETTGCDVATSSDAAVRARCSASLALAISVGLALVTLMTFLPALRNRFVNWDDDVNILNNHAYRGFDAERIEWMSTTLFGGHYQPLTWLSYAVDYAVWGMSPFGYHLSNVLLHIVGVLLFFRVAVVLLRWSFRDRDGPSLVATCWCAAFAAAVFALHPLRVESVAWVTERRDVLSGVFVFACLLAYFRATGGQRFSICWFALAVLLYALSLGSKAAALGLPAVLLVIDHYPARRPRLQSVGLLRLVVEKIPFLFLAGAAGWGALMAQRAAGAMRGFEEMDVLSRVATACHSFSFYLYKFFLPLNLSALYPFPPRQELLGMLFVVTIIVVTVSFILAVSLYRRHPAILAALLCYVLLLAPVSGLAQSGKQFVADRYSYLSLLPLTLLVAGLLLRMFANGFTTQERRRTAHGFAVLAGVFILGISMLAFSQSAVWHNSVSLWSHAVRVDSKNQIAYTNLGYSFKEHAKPKLAIDAFRRAIQLDSSDAKAHNGLGIALLDIGKPEEACGAFREAVRLVEDDPQYLCNLGYVLRGFGDLDSGAECYRRALELAPRMAQASDMLAAIYLDQQKFPEAAAVYAAALAQVHNNNSLRANYAWLLATCSDDSVRDGVRAVEIARALAEETGYKNPWVLDTLAAACAEAGDFEEAARVAGSALAIATERGESVLESDLMQRLSLYERGEPYRD